MRDVVANLLDRIQQLLQERPVGDCLARCPTPWRRCRSSVIHGRIASFGGRSGGSGIRGLDARECRSHLFLLRLVERTAQYLTS